MANKTQPFMKSNAMMYNRSHDKDETANGAKSNNDLPVAIAESSRRRVSPITLATNGGGGDSNGEIKELRADDVMLGRGPGLSSFVGNVRFRKIVNGRKDAYKSTTLRKEKLRIAEEVKAQVEAKGGRFIKQKDTIDDGNVWSLVADDIAIEKCKQSLREKHTPADTDEGATSDDARKETSSETTVPSPFTVTLPQDDVSRDDRARKRAAESETLSETNEPRRLPSVNVPFPPSFIPPSFQVSPVVPMAFLPQLFAGTYVDPRLLLFQNASLAFQQSQTLPAAQIASTFSPVLPFSQPSIMAGLNQDQSFRTMQASAVSETTSESDIGGEFPFRRKEAMQSLEPLTVEDGTGCLPDETVSESFLSILGIGSGQPRFTDEDEKREKASMTDTEKASVLAHLFGKMCISAPREHKRSRKDLDEDSIRFLIKQMRLELERIPNSQKQEYLEAQAKCRCRHDEFSDARMEQFLRCEGMNAELAAKRFVNYWKCRRAVFSPDKYLLRMTLNEALADDLDAVEDGVFCLLKHHDLSGRQLVYVQPSRRREGLYSSESLLRAIWYVLECTSQQNRDANCGFVFVINHRDTTLWNYDRYALDRVLYIEKSCMPVQCLAFHVCCPSSVCMKVLKPLTFVLSDKRARTRTVTHDVPESEIPDALAKYGILKEMLPPAISGTDDIDQRAWMANRRAMELEEI